MPPSNIPRRTLLLTGASRGIGHATAIAVHVKQVGRRMHKLKPLKQVRDLLSKFGVEWDQSIQEWRPNGDEF